MYTELWYSRKISMFSFCFAVDANFFLFCFLKKSLDFAGHRRLCVNCFCLNGHFPLIDIIEYAKGI